MTSRLLATLCLTATLVSACGTANQKAPAPVPAAETIRQSPAAHPDVPSRLQFRAATVDGQQFSGESLVGKPAVLWFWAPWCPTCQREAAEVARVARANPAVTFVGVAALDQLPAMQEFVSKYGVGFFTNIADVDGSVWQRFGVTAQPAFAFVHPDGFINVIRGGISESELATLTNALTTV